MNKSTISVTLLALLFLGSVETFAQKQIVRRVPNEPVVPQKQAQPTKTPTHHAPKKNSGKKKREYEYVGEYSDGLAMVQLNGKYGFIDKSGTLVIPCKYDDSNSFREGLAAVTLNGNDGYITQTEIWYDYAGKNLSNNLRLVKLNGKYGFIDKSGTEVIPCKYDEADSFREGLAKVVLKGKYGFVDKTGTEVIPCKYDAAESFSEGIAKAKLKGNDGYITQTGIWYDNADKNLSDNLRRVLLNDKWGFVDKTGTLVIPCKYDSADSFSGGVAMVLLNDKWGFVDKTGTEVIPCKYDEVRGLRDGLARVKLNGKWGTVNKSGVETWD